MHVDGELGTVRIGAAKERSLLATLALTPRRTVSTDVLITALWGDEPPSSARKTLQTYVWNLRQAFGNEIIATDPAGYALCVDPDDVDVARFRALVQRAEGAGRAGDVERARTLLTEAVSLWRDEPFSGVAPDSGLANQAVRLKEEYLSALEARIAADLAAGEDSVLVAELESLVREHPYREKLWGSLMVALYRSGRQADALDAYQRVRELLLEELGLEPGGELRRIEAAILNHDPTFGTTLAPLAPVDGRGTGMHRSPVQYARCADGVSVAYQVAGDGPIDILAIPGFVSHLDIWWNAPTDRLVRRLTAMGRLIWFDKRGMGLSDRPEQVQAERWVDDAMAVLDAVGSKRAVVLGVSAGATTSLLLAARHADRVRALALHGGFARALEARDYPIGWDRDTVEWFAGELEKGWGTGAMIEFFAPSRAEDAFVRDYAARYQQLSASPASAMRFFWAAMEADVRHVLADIQVPTLVVHADDDVIVPVAQARYVADHIQGAEFVGLDSDVHLICVSDVIDELTDAIESFIRRIVHA